MTAAAAVAQVAIAIPVQTVQSPPATVKTAALEAVLRPRNTARAVAIRAEAAAVTSRKASPTVRAIVEVQVPAARATTIAIVVVVRAVIIAAVATVAIITVVATAGIVIVHVIVNMNDVQCNTADKIEKGEGAEIPVSRARRMPVAATDTTAVAVTRAALAMANIEGELDPAPIPAAHTTPIRPFPPPLHISFANASESNANLVFCY